MSEESCGNCRFFNEYPSKRWDGTCRKSHPDYIPDSLSEFPPVVNAYWCGEWRAKGASGTTGKLYQLPNGQWITPSMVSAVAVYVDPRSPFVAVCFRDGGGQHEIDCQTKEAAEAMRDKIAADVNAMVGGAA